MGKDFEGVRILSFVLFVSVIAFVLFQGTKTPVSVTLNGETTEVYTHASTVEELLVAEDIDLTEYDKVTPSLSTEIDSGMSIEWEQAKEIIISVDGNQLKVWTTEKLVKNILEEANIEDSADIENEDPTKLKMPAATSSPIIFEAVDEDEPAPVEQKTTTKEEPKQTAVLNAP